MEATKTKPITNRLMSHIINMYRVRIADDGGDRSWIQMAIMGIPCFALFMLTWRLLNFLEPNSMLQTARSTCNETINARIKIEESEEG